MGHALIWLLSVRLGSKTIFLWLFEKYMDAVLLVLRVGWEYWSRCETFSIVNDNLAATCLGSFPQVFKTVSSTHMRVPSPPHTVWRSQNARCFVINPYTHWERPSSIKCFTQIQKYCTHYHSFAKAAFNDFKEVVTCSFSRMVHSKPKLHWMWYIFFVWMSYQLFSNCLYYNFGNNRSILTGR